jgi:protein SCO1
VKKILILAAILIVPSVAYMLLKTGKNNYKSLEFYGPKEPYSKTVNGNTVIDTVYHQVGGFLLLDADSLPVSDAITKDKYYVACFFFTNCKTICPKMTGQLMRVQYQFKEDNDVVILSHTVDPDFDTPSVLKAYAKTNTATPGKWYFLTGDKKTIYDLARSSYFISVSKGDGGVDDFIHSEQLVLVDKNKHIRGYYDGTDKYDVDKLIGDIKLLKFEEKASK